MNEMRVTGTAWGPRCLCIEHPHAHYHGSAFLIADAADSAAAERCRADEIAAEETA